MKYERRPWRHGLTALASAGLLTGSLCVGRIDSFDPFPDECFDEPHGVYSQPFCDRRVNVVFSVAHEESSVYRGESEVGLVVAVAWQEGGPVSDCSGPDWEALFFEGTALGIGEARGRTRVVFRDPTDSDPDGGFDPSSTVVVENVLMLLRPRSLAMACADRNSLELVGLRYRNPFLLEQGVRDMTYMLRRVSE